MNLFSKNIPLILKTFLYQIVISILGMMMYTAVSRNTALMIIGQISVLLFFFYIMWSQMYQQGAKNAEFSLSHQTPSSPFAGILFALIAFLPTILASLWTIISPPFAPNGEVLSAAGHIPYLLNKCFLMGMYSGIHQTLVPTVQGTDALNAQCILHLLSAIPGILVCSVGYAVGHIRFLSNKKTK